MYISCGDDGAAAGAESELGYVPNNPLLGLPPLDSPHHHHHHHHQECSPSCSGCTSCQGVSTLPIAAAGLLHGSDYDCGNCLDHNGILSQSGINGSYWFPEDMNSFPGLSSLDMDPLPSLFPFSPCGAQYKAERPTHDMADVLLSLKHAVHKPGAESLHSMVPQGVVNGGGGGHHQAVFPNHGHHQASVSYTVHPHQMLCSPPITMAGHQHQHQQQQHQQFQTVNPVGYAATTGNGGFYESSCSAQHPAPMYPSMSVNVSMNMTMHGYGVPAEAAIPMQCSQMQWPPQTPTSSGVNVLYPPVLSPTHYPGGATYSFTADFRPPPPPPPAPVVATAQMHPPPNAMMDTLKLVPDAISPVGRAMAYFPPNMAEFTTSSPDSPNYTQLQDPKDFDDESEDSNDDGLSDNKPNLCRLCGKSYARPSTLKTHLRTHSGERPYRCPDCNKSFSQAANLTAHVRTHTGQKPFRCPICDRRFSQSSSVTTHMRTHSGERPYRCRSCKKAFSDSSTLTKHLRIHSGEKPYQCKLCLLRFSQSGNLNRHMRVHGTTASHLT